MADDLYSSWAASAAAQVALAAAQQKYLKARLQLEREQFDFMSQMEKDKFAFEQAKQQFYETITVAQLTGMYEGNPIWQRVVQEAGLTGYYQGKPTLEREQFEAQTALGYLNLLANLRGPQNAFQYAKVIGNTPAGLRDIVRAAAGQFPMANPTIRPDVPTVPQSPAGLLNDALGGVPTGGPPTSTGLPPLPPPNVNLPGTGNNQSTSGGTVSPPGVQAPVYWWNYEPSGDGSYNIYPPGVPAPPNNGQFSSPTAIPGQEGAQMAQTFGMTPLPLPNQWSPQNINKMIDYQKDLLLAAYENQGHDPNAVWQTFQRSLPRATAGTAQGSVAAGF